MIAFLKKKWGRPDAIVAWPAGTELIGQQGLILFEIDGWNDAGGHATLWDGKMCYDHCYFNEPGVRYRTLAANFWALP